MRISRMLFLACLAALAAASLSCSEDPKGLPVGSACTAASECSKADTKAAVCLTEYKPVKDLLNPGTDEATAAAFAEIGLEFPNGYCSNEVSCATDADCGEGGSCFVALAGVSQETIDQLAPTVPFDLNAFKALGLCLQACTLSSECRQGYSCAWPLAELLELVPGTTKKTYCIETPDPCKASPCEHGGTCTKVDETAYTCSCAAGYTGTTCATNIDDCAASPCHNGGLCTDGVNDFTCVCADGYTGDTCDTNVDDCTPNPCVHGTCADGVADYTCTCADGWDGENCDVELAGCTPNPCLNGGTCSELGGGDFSCDCADGWTGKTCATAASCGSYTDVMYRLTGQFKVTTMLGTNTYSDLNSNSTSPVFDDATNTTPFTADGSYTAGFARLRFENDAAGNPKAGTVGLVELYFPLNYQQTSGATLYIDMDHSVGILAGGLANCGSGDATCTAHAPTVARACTVNAQGTLSGTTLAWDACTATSGSKGWAYSNARAATGAGCATNWNSWGHSGPCTAGMCSAVPSCSLGDSYQTWNQQLGSLTFSGTDLKTATISMPDIQLPNCTGTGMAGTTTWLSITSSTVIGTDCGSTPGTDLVCDVQ